MTLLDDFFNGAEGLWNSIQATADQSQEVVVYAGFSPDVIEAVGVPGSCSGHRRGLPHRQRFAAPLASSLPYHSASSPDMVMIDGPWLPQNV